MQLLCPDNNFFTKMFHFIFFFLDKKDQGCESKGWKFLALFIQGPSRVRLPGNKFLK